MTDCEAYITIAFIVGSLFGFFFCLFLVAKTKTPPYEGATGRVYKHYKDPE